MLYKDYNYSAEDLQAMRNWIADCSWQDLQEEEDITELSDYEVIKGVETHYDGGLVQFIIDSTPIPFNIIGQATQRNTFSNK